MGLMPLCDWRVLNANACDAIEPFDQGQGIGEGFEGFIAHFGDMFWQLQRQCRLDGCATIGDGGWIGAELHLFFPPAGALPMHDAGIACRFPLP